MAEAAYGSTTTHRPGPVYVDEVEERRLLDHGHGMIRSETRAAIRLTTYLLLTLSLIPVQAFAVLFRLRLAERLPRFYHRLCTRILGIQVVVRGRRVRERPVLFVANHVSYLDITALGSVVTGGFIAKSEVAGWPLFGILAKLQRTVFIARKRTAVAKHGDEIAQRLEAGDNLILFPEGTSGDGTRVLPFKSAFFSVAERRPRGQALTVQPVSIAYTRLNEVPLGRGLRPFFAWYGDMDLLPHLWTVAALGKLTVVIEFHAPVTVDEVGSRKALATKVQDQVAGGLARANAGR
ncbi:lysophospholipid acyltransferase family protein [Thalassobaculum litoreum]|uniref:1-acyl-sn-glycerol-3-phosphate acyltransferase n=1 Tax=Thalassobaculum litoreum DSM 18839 TaxID=1123362 RepID=A0A8G2EY97_9PROT|nr:lysophospholipid acyltransferase family protein [Thalassobaculum litoreum]SDF74969.1 1-acyl-sn-glycerol-3-phosphate acyltransferase [Thalassobaculum litoreum DSM 18839]